jgi:hypothetical protein
MKVRSNLVLISLFYTIEVMPTSEHSLSRQLSVFGTTCLLEMEATLVIVAPDGGFAH